MIKGKSKMMGLSQRFNWFCIVKTGWLVLGIVLVGVGSLVWLFWLGFGLIFLWGLFFIVGNEYWW